jgi:adenylosuccinate lyase
VIERYTLPEIGAVWTEEAKYRAWLEVELAVCRARARLGEIPVGEVEELAEKADFTVERIHEIEEETNHDVIAFVSNVAETVNSPVACHFHFGLTSSDVLDTATAVVLRDAADVVLTELRRLAEVTRRLAIQHRSTPMVGRTHGIHAEPITFGFKVAGWYAEIERDVARLERARDQVAVGKISGAVGSHANVSAEVEAFICERLGLYPDPASTQVVSRDRHAELLTALAILGGTLERVSVEIRHLQRTEVGEAFEPFGTGQQGSSAMPHKRNPILAERVSGMARLLRADALVGLENMALWHERDISHSSAERFVFERALGVAAYATRTLGTILDGLEVDAERMARNLEQLDGMVYSEALLLAMVAKGADRQEAYRLVQSAAQRSWRGERSFREELLADEVVGSWLDSDEIGAAMSLEHHLAGVEATYRRLGLDGDDATELGI